MSQQNKNSYQPSVYRDKGGNRMNVKAGGAFEPLGIAMLLDDFLGDALDARYSGAGGSDGQALAPAIAAAVGGVCRLVAGDSDTNFAADGSSLTHGLNWQADQGGLVLEARVKLASIAALAVCIGFTDALATGTFELPFSIGSSDALTSNASDACCFVFDTGADTDQWHLAGVDSNTDAGPAALGSAHNPAADTYQTFRLEIDASGDAVAYIDDVLVATLASVVSPDVALTPVIAVQSRTTATKTVDVDYLYVKQDR